MQRVLIVEAEDSTRDLIRQAFESQDDFAVCAEAKSGNEALEKIARSSPDLIVWGLSVLQASGMELLGHIKTLAAKTILFLLADDYDSALEKAAMAYGVAAVFSKKDDLDALVQNARAFFS